MSVSVSMYSFIIIVSIVCDAWMMGGGIDMYSGVLEESKRVQEF